MLPDRIYAGASFAATYSLADYPPADGWASLLVLREKTTQTVYKVGAVLDGSGFKVSASAAVTAAWEPGEYSAYLYATKGDDKFIVTTETMLVLPNPEGNKVENALRDELAAVDRCIAGVLAGEGVQSYSFETAVGRRQADRMNLAELRSHRADVVRRIDAEESKRTGKPSKFGWRKVQSTFNR